jgi:hypothetical protein
MIRIWHKKTTFYSVFELLEEAEEAQAYLHVKSVPSNFFSQFDFRDLTLFFLFNE